MTANPSQPEPAESEIAVLVLMCEVEVIVKDSDVDNCKAGAFDLLQLVPQGTVKTAVVKQVHRIINAKAEHIVET